MMTPDPFDGFRFSLTYVYRTIFGFFVGTLNSAIFKMRYNDPNVHFTRLI
jgi:hypothetical protein